VRIVLIARRSSLSSSARLSADGPRFVFAARDMETRRWYLARGDSGPHERATMLAAVVGMVKGRCRAKLSRQAAIGPAVLACGEPRGRRAQRLNRHRNPTMMRSARSRENLCDLKALSPKCGMLKRHIDGGGGTCSVAPTSPRPRCPLADVFRCAFRKSLAPS
jgi:hypothetical protein